MTIPEAENQRDYITEMNQVDAQSDDRIELERDDPIFLKENDPLLVGERLVPNRKVGIERDFLRF